MLIITKGKAGFNKDAAHQERKKIEQDLRNSGMFSKDKMDQRDCKDKDHEEKRVADYDRWKQAKDKQGMTNTQKQDRWHELNQQFKQHGIEGNKEHNTDQLRERKKIVYE